MTLTAREELCSALLAGQAAVGSLLWWAYGTSDTVRSWFDLVPDTPQVTDAFFWADAATVVASLVAAWAIRRRRRWAVAAVGLTTGLILYPTALLVAWVATTDGAAEAALAVMVPPAVINPLVLWSTHRTAAR